MKTAKNILLLAGFLAATSSLTGQEADPLPILFPNTATSDGDFVYLFGGILYSGAGFAPLKPSSNNTGGQVYYDVNEDEYWNEKIARDFPVQNSFLIAPVVQYVPGADLIYLFSGITNQGLWNELWSFDPAGRGWSQVTTTGQAPTGIGMQNMIPVNNGFFLVGGKQLDGYAARKGWFFNTTTSNWIQLPDLPQSSEFEVGVGVPLCDNQVFMWGGQGYGDGHDGWLCDLHNPTCWQKITTAPAQPEGQVPAISHNPFFGVTQKTNDEGKQVTDQVYVGGGFTSQGEKLTQFYRLDVSDWSWTRLEDIPEYRGSPAFTLQDGVLILYGGVDSNGNKTNTIYTYDTQTGTWNKQAVLPAEPLRATPGELFMGADYYETGDAQLGWNQGTEDPKGYRISRAEENGLKSGDLQWAFIGKVPKDSLSFTDTTAVPGTSYYYKVCGYNVAGNSPWTDSLRVQMPASANLPVNPEMTVGEPFPNPAAGQALISCTFPGDTHLSAVLLDQQGKTIEVLTNKTYPAGVHFLVLTTNGLAPGIYRCRISDGHSTVLRTVVVGSRSR